VTSLLVPLTPHAASNHDGPWKYWRPGGCGIIELGTVRGVEVALPSHFHQEDQITFTLAGRRRFVIADEVVEVAPGHGLRIPAGTPHRSLSGASEVVCINMYTPLDAYAGDDVISALARLWRRTGQIGWRDLAIVTQDHQRCIGNGAPAAAGSLASEPWATVGQVAQRTGMSREGFSRQFKKRHGLPPHAFWLLEKLNEARRRLRTGEPVAAVAADAGFSDQSHLGRCFRRAFGVTPGRYRAG
jgi:AraC-like DNA-binding protein